MLIDVFRKIINKLFFLKKNHIIFIENIKSYKKLIFFFYKKFLKPIHLLTFTFINNNTIFFCIINNHLPNFRFLQNHLDLLFLSHLIFAFLHRYLLIYSHRATKFECIADLLWVINFLYHNKLKYLVSCHNILDFSYQ